MIAIILYYWKRRVTDAICIQEQDNTMNLDCQLCISLIWKQVNGELVILLL